ARIVVAGEPHHITQRGNNRQDAFFVADDRVVYLQFLREYAARYRFQIHAYCLMTNHVHIVGIPEEEASLAKAIGRTHFRYSQYINQMHGRSGHLWQGRFHSCLLDEDYYGNAVHYVEQNPVRARMVRKAWRYPWSSAGVHCGTAKDDGLLDLALWRDMLGDEARWRSVLEKGIDPEFQAKFRQNTQTGRPLGTDSFLSKLEHALGRRVRALPVGRPRKRREGV
ncbi:MAG: transposase, partial [Candidatus Hydrogenedentes bacterium]|nr:transposase [Candidatus Hydrogenedentota bacterium]